MMRYLVIGAGGHAQEVAWSLREMLGGRAELSFFDDRVPPGPLPSGLGAVVGPLDAVAAHTGPAVQLVLGVALPRLKASVVARLAPLALPWTTVVHPAATIGPNVQLGEGSYVAAGAIVTVNVRAGRFTTINMHCQAAPDVVLEDLATLHPGARLAGGVTVGEGAELGTATIALPGVTIGAWAVLGAGCVALRSLPGGRTYVGVPAREVQRRGRVVPFGQGAA
jgi:sugar O-acyltransferase (sialic acid O-acetyltransferase NeuD family)